MAFSFAKVIQLLAALLSLFVLMKVVEKRSVPKVRFLIWLSLSVCFFALGYLLELDAQTLEGAYMAQRVRHIGVSTFAVFFYFFIRDYGNRRIRSGYKRALFYILPLLTLWCINLYPECRLYYADIWYETAPTPHLDAEYGILRRIHTLYSFALILLSMVEILRYFPKQTKQEKRSRRVFLLAALLPSLATVVLAMEPLSLPMDLGSAALVLAELVLGGYILRYRREDWLPFAREGIVENLRDGFILIDAKGRFLDANAVARGYFSFLQDVRPGTYLADTPGYVPRRKGENELALHTKNGEVVLKASASPILHDGEVVCICIMYYDVTGEKRLMRELERRARQDELTGLLNRSTFFSAAQRDFDLSRRLFQPSTMLMLDIDHFKRVNDTYGHQCGDQVLAGVAAIIAGRMRNTDIAGRYGGEEFTVFLPATDAAGAEHIAEEIRATVEAAAFPWGQDTLHITISIGVAEQGVRHDSLEALVAEADIALYAAKEAGRNRVLNHAAQKGQENAENSTEQQGKIIPLPQDAPRRK